MDDAYTVERFGAEFWSFPDQENYPEPRPDHLLAEGASLPIPDAELFIFRETLHPEGCVLWRRRGLLVACDSIQHWESTDGCSAFGAFVTRAIGWVRPKLSFMHPANLGPFWVPTMTRLGGSLRPDFERLLELPFDHLVGAHGQPLLGGAHTALRASVERVLGRGVG